MDRQIRRIEVLPNARPDEIEYLIENMRPEDVEEAEAWGLERDELLLNLPLFTSGPSWVVYHGDSPIFAMGLYPTHHRAFNVWGFGAPAANKYMGELGRWMRANWFEEVFAMIGARRIEVKVPLKSERAWMWLMWLGAKLDCKLKRFGVRGEDFLLLSYTDEDYRNACACSAAEAAAARCQLPSPAHP